MTRLIRSIIPFLFLLTLLALPSLAFSAITSDTVVHWKSVKEVMELQKKEKRPIMVYFYDPGHDTSMLLLNDILDKRELTKYIGPRFYAVKIDITATSIYWFNQKIYTRKPASRYNDLAFNVFGDKPIMPSFLFFNKESSGLVFKGFRSRYEMRCLLVYISEEIDKTTPYSLWFQSYRVAYPMINLPDALKHPIHWITLDEALEKQKTEPKKLFIYWSARLNVGSTVMVYNAFENVKIADYMNEHFYCVRLDARTEDTLFWKKTMINRKQEDKFHDLALEQLNGEMKFPSLLFYDAGQNLLFKQQSYLGPLNFYALANFIGTDSYRKTDLKTYLKTFSGTID